MSDYEALDSLASVISFTANLVVARACLSAYCRTKLRPFLVLGISGILAIVNLVIQEALIKIQPAEEIYNALWITMTLIWIIDALLYAIGISGLISHYLPKKSEPKMES